MDMIDLQLVELLRDNARLSFAELARQVGLSPPAVHERVAKLESTGVILAYRAEIAPEALGLGVTAWIGVVQSPDAEPEELIEGLRGLVEIESCFFLAGTEAFLLKVRVATMAELEHLIVRMRRMRGIAQTRTTIALSTKWDNRPRPGRHVETPVGDTVEETLDEP
ncbi:MAG TPA: Lrp/AsnC family transcriptional regulator [Micromonosporaceae bacterium]|nr:Lrp/AsnC family transcriptional regulator [Micromonosporaceae bacterium]